MNNWKDEIETVQKNLWLLEDMIMEAMRRIHIINQRVDQIERRKERSREFLQN
jgi:hypothetical protein